MRVFCLGGCLPRGCLLNGGCLPGGCLPEGGCLPIGVYHSMHWGRHPLCTEFLTHTCQNITFPQLCLKMVITACKQSLGQGNIFRSVCQEFCPQGFLSQLALQVVSQHALQQVSRGWWYPSMPCRFPGLHPGWKLRGIWPMESPGHNRGGGLGGSGLGVGGLQAHTQRGSWGGSGLGSAPRECLLQEGCRLWRGCGDPSDGYCCGRYASYWNAFLLQLFIAEIYIIGGLNTVTVF